MINKKYLSPIINDEFPDLKNTQFEINGRAVSHFTENTLLPFLIYQNTTDSKNRLIQLFLQDNSPSIHFLPFYVAVGFYRKAIDTIFSGKNFSNLKYEVGKKKVTFNGNVCSITNVNFLNKSITLCSGTGFVFEISIAEDFRLGWRYPESNDLRRKLVDFDKVLGASDHNLFTLPIPKEDKNHEGIIVFTPISKFEALLRNLKVSGSSLNDYIGIHRTVFDNNSRSITFRQISGAKTKDRLPTVLASRVSDLFAYDNILSAGKGQYNHLKTIIIEDFDLELRSWERNGTLQENLEAMNEIYFSRLGKGIKDIYLVCRNRNFDTHSILLKNKITPMTWLLTPQETSELDESDSLKEIVIKEFSEPQLFEFVVEIEQILLLWKSLSEQYFCNGQSLDIVLRLYCIREKLNSFYSPYTFEHGIIELKKLIYLLKSQWFASGQDDGIIERTKILLDTLISVKANPSEQLSLEITSSINDKHKLITIITNNKDKDDHHYLLSIISLTEVPIRFYTVKEFLSKKPDHFEKQEKLIYLVWNKEVVNKFLTEFSIREQLFLINKRGCQFLRTYSLSAWRSISSISTTIEKYGLLNIENIGCVEQKNPFPKNITFIDKVIELDQEHEIVPLPELEESIVQVVSKIRERNTTNYLEEASVNVFFEDGSYLSFAENRSVFYYDEQSGDTTADLQKEVKNLEENDLIIVPKNKIEIKKLLNDTLSGNEDFATYVSNDLEWRYKLESYIIKSVGDLSHFRERLKDNGIKIEADITIRNWIEGETLEPRNFNNILLTLAKMSIIDSEKASIYLKGAKVLKKLKSTFIRTAMQKLIYSLKGINFNAIDELFDENLLNSFLDHVEMKKVLVVIGGKNAY